MIDYGLHIDARVEMSTLGETNNAQFFLNLKVVRFYRDSNSGMLKSGEPDEPEFLDPWSQQI